MVAARDGAAIARQSQRRRGGGAAVQKKIKTGKKSGLASVD
jgi:hypothetical protein